MHGRLSRGHLESSLFTPEILGKVLGSMEEHYDVAIIGGGPAGSAAACFLAQHGRKVVVLERDRFPRFHIGESLLPYSLSALDRLGMREWMDKSAFPKYGGEIATACGTRAVKFYFKNGFRLQHKSSYQVERSVFDQKLLETARESGAEIREETRVDSVVFDKEAVALSITGPSGSSTIQAKFLFDCTGRNSFLGRHFDLKIDYPHLKKFSCFAHYEHVQRDEGIDAGLTRLVRGDTYWFWLIPVDERRTSIGVVMDTDDFKARKLTPTAALDWAIADSPLMTERMAKAQRVTEPAAIGDYSYRNRKLTGDRWMMLGDAAGFIDPIFSTGVFLAIHSAEQAADAVHAILDSPRKQAGLFRRYEKGMHRIMDLYLRFVTAWYRPEFVEVFTTPTERLQLAPAINAVLAGNIGTSFPIWWRMNLFYLVLFLQRRFALCPRLERRSPGNPLPAVPEAV